MQDEQLFDEIERKIGVNFSSLCFTLMFAPVMPNSSFASRFRSGVFNISFTMSKLFAAVARCNKFFFPCFLVSTGGGRFFTKFFSFVQMLLADVL